MSAAIQKILFLLKQKGPTPLQPIADALSMTTMGARGHLKRLEQDTLVAFEDRSQGPGRPARHWFLTEAGHQRFGDRHPDLTLQLLDSLEATLGTEGMSALLLHRQAQQQQQYQTELGQLEGEERLQALATLRHQEGYMARLEPQGEGWLLIEDHCPICAAAKRCQGFCQGELELFRLLLAPQWQVDRTEHLLSEGQRCCYSIKPSSA
ncbi:helix-turn-helix transcriptional regulator [Ferrimonas marina]|uniref:Predicted transcriptional regulator, ArsR family n=1 Tax=Ferrimonas marina TaxID=299255 RepID=A0A1M5YVG7_9GAMM|nr:metalloregulator ArsR/SmtB family transcription factor [Ferrimonas marina]SHI16077.1 Predicted transcriptional regulator, ArsR family [Ferrimonas marina]